MPSPISRYRLAAFKRQSGLCYYCSAPMWNDGQAVFAAVHNLSLSQAARFRCTAEHLVARQDGGKNANGNIVAACSFCNRTRHRMKVALNHEAYKEHVTARMRRLKWHPRQMQHLLAGSASA